MQRTQAKLFESFLRENPHNACVFLQHILPLNSNGGSKVAALDYCNAMELIFCDLSRICGSSFSAKYLKAGKTLEVF